MALRLVFMGTPDFAVPTLDAIVEAGHKLTAVYTRPPRPALAAPPVRGSGTHCIKFAQTIRERFPAVFCDPPFFHCSVAQHVLTF